MENERPNKRHSLLPQRSASGVSNPPTEKDENAKLTPPSASAKNRDVSPSKLPVGGGGLKRSTTGGQQANRQSSIPSRGSASSSRPQSQSHKPQSGSVSLSKIDAAATPGAGRRTPATSRSGGPASSSRKVASGSSGDHETSSRLTRSAAAHKATPSLSSRKTDASGRSSSPVKEGRSSNRILANVKVQRPAAATNTSSATPSTPSTAATPATTTTSPRKTATSRHPSGPATHRYALLTTPVPPAQRPIQDLKLELLHLHTLQKHAESTKSQWAASAKQHYRKTFNRLVLAEDELRASELDFLEQRNAAALIEWCRSVSSASGGESKTRVLSAALDQIWMLLSPAGRYTAAIAAFEDWVAVMERSHELRILGRETRRAVDIMHGLGDGWKAEVDGIMAGLCATSDSLEALGPAVEPSDLARCLNVLVTLLANMLDELMLIRDVEQRLVERESSWVEQSISSLGAAVSSGRPGR